MSGKTFVAGAWRTVSNGRISIDGANWKRITRGYHSHDGATWKSLGAFVPPLSVNAPSQVAIVGPPKPTPQTIVAFVTATPSGGFPPYAYLFELVSHVGNVPIIDNATTATARISKSVPGNADLTDSFKVTVTDSLGAVAVGPFSIEFINQPVGT